MSVAGLGLVLGALAAGPARAEEALPLWELGAGMAAISVPDYPGSDQSDNYVLPVPYVIYRGDFFQADRDGMRARMVDESRFEVDVSMGATPPVYSGDSDTRSGMPDLSPAIEIGPELRWHIARAPGNERTREWEWDFNLPVRHSQTVLDGHWTSVGNLIYPHVNWRQRFHAGADEWDIDADLGAYFNDRSYHRYFYEVAPRYATASRPAYSPHAGYGGWEASVYTSHSIGAWRAIGFVEFGSIGGAAFEQSPLVRRMFTLTAGLGLTWVFWTSDTRRAGR